MSFYVDIPQVAKQNTWRNIAVTATRLQAQKLLADRFGIEAEYSAVFITEGDADLKPAPWEVDNELPKVK